MCKVDISLNHISPPGCLLNRITMACFVFKKIAPSHTRASSTAFLQCQQKLRRTIITDDNIKVLVKKICCKYNLPMCIASRGRSIRGCCTNRRLFREWTWWWSVDVNGKLSWQLWPFAGRIGVALGETATSEVRALTICRQLKVVWIL